MEINVRGKNIEVTEALVDYAQKKISKLTKYLDRPKEAKEAQVVMSVIRNKHIVEVTVILNGLILRGEESTGDMYASIDKVVDKLEKQLVKYKTRLNRSLRQQSIRAMNEKLLPPEMREEEEAEKDRVVKTKRFPLKPMHLEEAIMQMNLLGHDFFVFANAETESVNVLYRRKDGDYGLIEPEYGS
ncbi:MAG: ribosome-associated translation inhibitor RaiA [Dethiobacteria bacterium]|jgi:putative sigma-54 modulation protein|nr:ribosome-associated translation inhibitor RaiA [Bacillota bacterium]NMD33241.1 ribosome-associated translation inhibitor RaiA [Bacillota bacterium]HOB29044.1 ribosome-associated translation inhibitor RaiA [Bacillota bacterium]HPZ41128.1 ribosome-associated translation inhibitor RaiA [Bacillota bacterium]HQD52627.1 ribosome-associated translation inhibitor RaiA [Bacillota bacterium]